LIGRSGQVNLIEYQCEGVVIKILELLNLCIVEGDAVNDLFVLLINIMRAYLSTLLSFLFECFQSVYDLQDDFVYSTNRIYHHYDRRRFSYCLPSAQRQLLLSPLEQLRDDC